MCLLSGTSTPVSTTTTTTKEKRRWSFRRSSASRELNLAEFGVTASSVTVQNDQNAENDQRKHDPDSNGLSTRCVEEAAAIKIQSVFLALFQHFYFIGLLMKSIFFCFSFLGVGVLFKV